MFGVFELGVAVVHCVCVSVFSSEESLQLQ